MAIHIHLSRSAKDSVQPNRQKMTIELYKLGQAQGISSKELNRIAMMSDANMQKEIDKLRQPVRDAHPRKANFTIDDIAIGGTVIYKDGSDFKMSKASSKSGMRIKLTNGKEISVGDVWSTDASDWKSFETATKDSVESVEKEIRTQQRLIDVAKRMGKDVPGQVTQRMKFLQEELEKAKNPRTDDAALKSSFGTAAEHQSKARELKAAGNEEAAKHHGRAASVLQQAEAESTHSINKKDPATVAYTVKQLLETAEKHVQAARGATKDSEEFKSREEFKNVMLKSQDAFRAARNVVMLAGRAGDKGAAAKAQAIADLLDRAADMAHGLA